MTVKKEFLAWIRTVLVVLVPSVLAYLALAPKLGFYSDDWYSIYALATRGAGVFWQIFSFDRPARALLMIPLYTLFGANAPLYSYSGYAVRLAGALFFAWMVDRIWPGRRWAAGLAALIYLVYPGFLEQPKAFDFQSHLWSISAGLASVALSVRAQLPDRQGWRRAGLLALSVPLTLFYLSQMEYFIGLEGLRALLMLYLCLRERPAAWKRAAAGWAAAVVPVLAFLVWRVAFFHGQRSDTDLGRIFGQLAGVGLAQVWLGVHLLQDAFNVLLSAWVIPLYRLSMTMRLRETLFVGGMGLLAGAVVALYLWGQLRQEGASGALAADGRAMIWIGLGAALIALLPAELGGRRIEFLDQTRYTLPVSVGVGLLAAGLLASLSGRRLIFAAVLICGLSVAAHAANASQHASEWQSARDFWWQLSWRAPQIRPGTALLAAYPNNTAPLEYVIWGPANLIYYPAAVEPNARLALSAIIPTPDTFQSFPMQAVFGSDEKGILTEKDYQQALVLWMPEGGCLKALDGRAPELSETVNQAVYLAAGYSRLERIDLDGPGVLPPAAVFGPEPAHNWCYYFEKASLARQRGDWAEVARLGDAALASGPDAVDRVELMPFIQAYANQGEFAKADRLARFVLFSPWLRHQACAVSSKLAVPSGAGQEYLVQTFCH